MITAAAAGTVIKNLPWGAIAKGAVVVGVIWFSYSKGASDKDTEWVAAENARIRMETTAKLNAQSEKSKLDVEQAANTADRLARAEVTAKHEKSRADAAVENQNKTRSANYVLAQNLKTAQQSAAASGNTCGAADADIGVRNHFSNRLDDLRRRGSTGLDLRDQDRPENAPAAEIGLAGAARPSGNQDE